jgi:hypothetical protein
MFISVPQYSTFGCSSSNSNSILSYYVPRFDSRAVQTYILLIYLLRGMRRREEGGARWSSGQCARRAIAKAKHRSQWPVIGWVTKNLLCRAPPCFGRHVKPFVPVAFAIVSTHSSFMEG